jgi:hypothetical protein
VRIDRQAALVDDRPGVSQIAPHRGIITSRALTTDPRIWAGLAESAWRWSPQITPVAG